MLSLKLQQIPASGERGEGGDGERGGGREGERGGKVGREWVHFDTVRIQLQMCWPALRSDQ